MPRPLNLYVAATRQNDGKTITALGLFNALKDHFPSVGYIKPVGQQFRLIGDHKVDKDASLMGEVFQIGGELPDMSPVVVPPGFTEDYIRHGDTTHLADRIREAYERASRGREFMVIEGTGHAGVGSVFGLSNAAVARLLGAPAVLVTGGGIGKPIDEALLNKAVFDQHGVPLVGVIVNKVMPEKLDKIAELVRLGFRRRGIDVLGVIPFNPPLSSPTMRQLREDIDGELIAGESRLDAAVSRIVVGAMPPHTILEYFKGDVLLVTPGNREDLILAATACTMPGLDLDYSVKGMVLTCGVWPNQTVLRLLQVANIPTIIVKDDTFTTAQKISQLIIKIRPQDTEKIAMVKELVRKYVDIEGLIAAVRRLHAAASA